MEGQTILDGSRGVIDWQFTSLGYLSGQGRALGQKEPRCFPGTRALGRMQERAPLQSWRCRGVGFRGKNLLLKLGYGQRSVVLSEGPRALPPAFPP